MSAITESPDWLKIFINTGIPEQKAKETLKNAAVTNNLKAAINEVSNELHEDLPGMLLYHMASNLKPQVSHYLPVLTRYITCGQLNNTQRIDAAIEYLLGRAQMKAQILQLKEFEEACGIGIVVQPEEIEAVIQEVLLSHKEALLEQRYRYNTFKIMQEVRQRLKWADAKHIKSEIDVQVFHLLGPKTEDDLKPVVKKKAAKQAKNEAAGGAISKEDVEVSEDGARTIAELMKTKVHLHAPGDNYRTDGYVVTPNTERLLKEHLERTGGKVHTRFPPEPNGILHIGHAKAININFGYAAAQNGICYLRYDDTNPEKEEEQFFVGIKDMVEWLGYKPAKITHSSDYFPQLYEWALVLIRKGLAYVCHQTADEMKGFDAKPSPWRNRPISENLDIFEDMRNGLIDEGKATLRMKVTLEEGKLDPVAYRIKFTPHHRTGDAWCIYPTYDYTHCLCDSIEDITHSLCTKEFQSRRSSYYWLCNALDIYCPVQWEYGRLNMNYALVSKRKIAKLISKKIVNGWDDPRLFTLTALRRRGFPAESINNFCAQMGVTGAQMAVDPSMLEAAVRDTLNVTAPRRLVVVNTIEITICNYPYEGPVTIEVPNFPQFPERGTHKVTFDRKLYIDKHDFHPDPGQDFRRLTLKQSVGLRHTGLVIKIDRVRLDKVNGLIELFVSCEKVENTMKPKAFIQWVSNPKFVEVRMYENLFHHKNPEDTSVVPGGFLSDINENSMSVLEGIADANAFTGAQPFQQFQFERMGFFAVDPDTTDEKMVFNLTVNLKEDANKESKPKLEA